MNVRIVLVSLLALALCSCASAPARQHALVPALQSSWEGVRADVVRGLAGAPGAATDADLAVLDAFVLAPTPASAAPALEAWPRLMLAAQAGIEADLKNATISWGVAQSLQERLYNFQKALQLAAGIVEPTT